MSTFRSVFFSGLKVVDLGAGMAPALVTSLLGRMGARVTRIEPARGDPFYDVYPAYRAWHRLAARADAADLARLLGEADVCVTGGEDHPGLERVLRAADAVSSSERAVVLDIAGSLPRDGGPAPAVDVLAQARTGFAFEHRPGGPLHCAFPAPSYGAALQGLFGLLAALLARTRAGSLPAASRLVSTSLDQGAAMWLSGDWMSAERPDRRFDFSIPKGVRPLVFRCADGGWIHFVTGTPGSLAKLYRVLGIDLPVDPDARGMPDPAGGLENFFGKCEMLAGFVIRQQRDALLQALWREGIAAEPVLPPGETWDDAQTALNDVVETAPDGGRSVGSPIRMRRAGPRAEAPGAPARATAGRSGPLAGVRVVDLGAFVAGPYASKLMADLGADVIKIEPPAGDPSRMLYRTFFSANLGKRSVCIDAKSEDGRRLIRELCASADVVHHNFRPGVAERMGVGPDDLSALRPGVVTLESFAYGARGPKAANSGFDMVFQALCGHEVRNAGEGRAPLWIRMPLVDYACGALGGVAALAGLLEREASGEAVHAEVDLLSAGVWMISELVQRPDGGFAGAPGNNAAQTGLGPCEAFYEASDGWIAIAARTEACRRRLAAALGLGELPEAPADCGVLIAGRVARLTAGEALAALSQAGVWAERCVEDGWTALRDDPAARRAGAAVSGQSVLYGRVHAIGALSAAGGDGAPVDDATFPAQGADTAGVLAELGYGAEEIDRLRLGKVIA
jgi:crotonobetainyl-CoA:carnitine CoA-transferase CaiB-like acyl-CoA transferase